MTKIFFCAFLILFTSCGKTQNTASLKPNETIIEADKKMEWVFGKNYTNWAPEAKDIETAEKLLKESFEDQKKATVNRLLNRSVDDYNMQFIGAITENGEKIIWINSFCKKEESSFKEWKTKIFGVADGGNCFFNVKINITKNTYYDLMVNGNA
jgi:hypothetical protein